MFSLPFSFFNWLTNCSNVPKIVAFDRARARTRHSTKWNFPIDRDHTVVVVVFSSFCCNQIFVSLSFQFDLFLDFHLIKILYRKLNAIKFKFIALNKCLECSQFIFHYCVGDFSSPQLVNIAAGSLFFLNIGERKKQKKEIAMRRQEEVEK